MARGVNKALPVGNPGRSPKETEAVSMSPDMEKEAINRASLRFIKGWRLHVLTSSQQAQWEDPSQARYATSYRGGLHVARMLRDDIDMIETEAGRVYFLGD